MGSIHKEPLSELVKKLSQELLLHDFVETGTYKGDGTEFATTVFDRVTTIEINPAFQEAAKTRLSGKNVCFELGDSATVLPKVLASLHGPALFWLDGHAGGGFYSKEDNCPLIAELNAIAASPFEHVIFVDDARAFVAPPPPPFNSAAWPTLVEVIEAARKRFAYQCVIINDVIMFTPLAGRPFVTEFCTRVRPTISK